MKDWFHAGRVRSAGIFLIGVVVATAGTATASSLITGKQIKNGTISASDLNGSLRKQLAKIKSVKGAKGDPGPPGAKGDPGPSTGTAGGDLTGSYPNPTIKQPDRVAVPPAAVGTSCDPSNPNLMCRFDGSGGLGHFGYFNNPVSGVDYLGYYVEAGGFVEFYGGAQFIPAGGITGNIEVMYLPKGRRPSAIQGRPIAAYPVDGEGNPDLNTPEVAWVRLFPNGAVRLGRDGGKEIAGVVYDLNGVRVHVG